MAQPALHLIIGNYNTSSWSLRAWLALRLAKLAFDETRIPLRLSTTPGRIAEFSPSGKLPVLLAEGVPIWDLLAIAEFVAELEPGIWPLDPIARAEARAVAAEMHSGFAELRRLMPMDVVSRFAMPGRLPRRARRRHRSHQIDLAALPIQICCQRPLPVRRLLGRRCDDGPCCHALRDAWRAARRRRWGLCRQRDELAGHGHMVRRGIGRAGGKVGSGRADGSHNLPRRPDTGRGNGSSRRIRQPSRTEAPAGTELPEQDAAPLASEIPADVGRCLFMRRRRWRWRQEDQRILSQWMG